MTDRTSANEISKLMRRFASASSGADFTRVSHERLMEESQRSLSKAAVNGESPEAEIVAMRILESPRSYRHWEDEHSTLMNKIAAEKMPGAQKNALLTLSLSLVHRKALFEFLRDHAVQGEQRRQLIEHFCAQGDYARFMIAEHGRYLRSAASYLCSNHVGRNVMFDALFGAPLAQYESLYNEYFRNHCKLLLLASDDPLRPTMQAMLSSMKSRIADWRTALLALTQSQSGTWRRPKF